MKFILLAIFRPSLPAKTVLSRPYIFTMGEKKDGRKKGHILKTETGDLH